MMPTIQSWYYYDHNTLPYHSKGWGELHTLANKEKKSQIFVILTPYWSVRGAKRPFFVVDFCLCVRKRLWKYLMIPNRWAPFTLISPRFLHRLRRPQPELDSSHVINVSCLTIKDDAYDPSLDAIVTITPCLINPGDGATYTYRPWRSVGLANKEKKSQIFVILTPYWSVRGAKRPFFVVDFQIGRASCRERVSSPV